ncbi:fimbrial protein [Salmonella enterica]
MNHFPRHRVWGLLLSTTLMSTAANAAQGNWSVEGAHGVLNIEGFFAEGACRLDMTSEMQQISLGATPVALLKQAGDQAQPTVFKLKLRDCIRSGGNLIAARSGNMTWDPYEPVVDITFIAATNKESPDLVKVSGVTGMGLRLTDSSHQILRLGERVSPRFITPHSDELVFYVQPVRTSLPLTPGSWQATVRFRLNYD